MRIFTLPKIGGLGLFLLGAAYFNLPLHVYSLLSGDGILEDVTLIEIGVFRKLLFALAAVTFGGLAIWMSLRGHPLRERIFEDFTQYTGEQPSTCSVGHRFLVGWSFFLAFFVLVLLLVIRLSFRYRDVKPAWYLWVTDENGVLETFTAVALLAAGLIFISCAFAVRASVVPKYIFVVPAAFGVLLCMGAGEELSWGQKWLGFATPEVIKSMNVQGEFNLHNLGGYWANHVMLVIFLLYVGVLPILATACTDLRYVLDRLYVPIPPLLFAPYGVFSIILDEASVFRRLWGDPPFRLSEAREVLFAAVVLGVALHTRKLWGQKIEE